jgi:hypothetical protein
LVIVTFSTLVIVRRDVLFAPPTADQVGVWHEGGWLLENNFDFEQLRTSAIDGDQGGPRCYVTTLLPAAAALLTWITGSLPAAFLLYRLLTFACAATCAALVAQLIRDDLPAPASWLAGIATVTVPLFATQTELLGMEIPMITFALLSAWFAQRERFVLAATSSLASFALKNTGLLITASLLGFFIVLLALRWRELEIASRRKLIMGVAAALLVLVAEFGALYWGKAIGARLSPVVIPLVPFVLICSPDLVALLLVALIHLAVVVRQVVETVRHPLPSVQVDTTIRSPQGLMSLFNWSVIALTFLATSRVTYHPRYLTLATPFVMVEFARTLSLISATRRRAVSTVVLLLIVVLNLFNHAGCLFPALPPALAIVPTYRERSREYLIEDRLNHQAISALRSCGGQTPVFAPETVLYYAVLPWLGFIERPLTGYTAFQSFPYAQFQNIERILVDRPSELIVVAMPRTCEANECYAFSGPQPGDELLFSQTIDVPRQIYRRRFELTGDSEPYERFLAEQLTPNEDGLKKAKQLAAQGYPDVLRWYLEMRAAAIRLPRAAHL